MSDKIKYHEIRVRPIPEKMFQELSNVAKNYGVSHSHLLKPLVAKFLDETPEKYKQPPID